MSQNVAVFEGRVSKEVITFKWSCEGAPPPSWPLSLQEGAVWTHRAETQTHRPTRGASSSFGDGHRNPGLNTPWPVRTRECYSAQKRTRRKPRKGTEESETHIERQERIRKASEGLVLCEPTHVASGKGNSVEPARGSEVARGRWGDE